MFYLSTFFTLIKYLYKKVWNLNMFGTLFVVVFVSCEKVFFFFNLS